MPFHSHHLDDADRALARAFDGITRAEATARAGGKWSAADICEHLSLAFELNGATVAKAVAERRTRLRPATTRQRFWKWLVVDLGYLPRAKSPEAVVPRGDRGVMGVEDVRARLAALDAGLAEAAATFGERTPILNHPILGPFSVRDWRRFHAIHVQHHVKQVKDRVASLRRGGSGVAE